MGKPAPQGQPETQGQPQTLADTTNSPPPPSYASHTNDRPFYDDLPTRNPYAQHRQQVGIAEQFIYEAPPGPVAQITGPLSLTLDLDLIYPTVPPSDAAYALSHELTSDNSTRSLTISRSNPPTARHGVTEKELYTLTRQPFRPDDIEVKGLRRSAFDAAEGNLYFLRSGLLRQRDGECEMRFRTDAVAIKCSADGKWKDVAGGRGIVAVGEVGQYGKETIVFVEGVLERTRDVVVALWCARVWHKRRSISLSRDEFRRRINSGSMMFG